jgi:nucleoside-diphosphate-sugar epimerase
MSRETIAVFGASGFVGSTLVERLLAEGHTNVVPLIHSSGNAARLARHGLDLRMVDLLSPSSVSAALAGCTAVVNCARGGKDALIRGLQNLLDASLAARVRRFIHISSVAAYGDAPPGDVLETLDPRPEPDTYGASKLAQDMAIKAAVHRGLPAVIICPPNISGPHSPFLLEIVQALRSGIFALVDDGQLPCELIDVENLVHAIRLGLDPSVVADGERIFVTDATHSTWRDLVASLMPLAEAGPAMELTLDEAVQRAAAPPPPRLSPARALRHLLSSDVRDALRKDPLIAQAETLAKRVAGITPVQVQKALRRHADGPLKPRKAAAARAVSMPLLRQQLRRVRYSQLRARTVLHYQPIISVDQSMDAFRRWYGDAFGWNGPSWILLKQLYH